MAATFTLVWDPSPSVVTGYRLYESVGTATFTYRNSYSGTSADITPLPSTNQVTRWYVTAYYLPAGTTSNPNGEGPASNIWTNAPTVTQPPPVGIPSPPSNLRAVQVTGNRWDLSWGGDLACSTQIEMSTFSGPFAQIATTPPGTQHYTTQVKKKTDYAYRARAVNAAGTSDPSNIVLVYWR